MFGPCTESVSILRAMILGTGDACVRIDMWSLLSAFGAFIACVLIAQFAARRLWARLTRPKPAFSDVHEKTVEHPITDDPNYQHSAIRSSKR